jgi:serine/threonine protein kinase
MSLIGTQIAHYLIEEKIGEGGMGIVYKAEDTRLKRKVALKFLKAEALGNEQEKARFLREAQTAAALDHPNICTIFEVNEYEGQTYIAMAFIDGQNIDEKMEAGPLSVDEAINISIQAAEGLQAANEKGVVHRDIKSANIMITRKGQVKIMDFGLAKLAGQAKKITLSGMTPGTVAYMSPEQARGEEVDHRSDIWSLGVVLYEMITGQLPFKGEYERAMLYSIMSEAPEPITDLRTDVPIELEQIINKALQKAKEDRYQSVDEMLLDLQQLPLDIPSIALKRPTPKIKTLQPVKAERPHTIRLMLLGLGIVLAVFIIISIFYRTRKTGKTIPATDLQITFTGKASLPAISPDGKSIAYVSEVSPLLQKVLVQDIQLGQAVGQAIEVFNDKGIRDVQWSPNGAELLITSSNDSTIGSYIVPRLGGTFQKISKIWHNECWFPDGSKIACNFEVHRRIYLFDKTTGDTNHFDFNVPITWIKAIDWSPLGNLILFLNWCEDGSEIWVIRADGGNPIAVVKDPAHIYYPRWSAAGDAIYFLRSRDQMNDLMKIRVSSKTGKAQGPAKVIQSRLATFHFSISKNNCLLYGRRNNYSNIWLIAGTRKGFNKTIKPVQLTHGNSLIFFPAISPDGKAIAYTRGSYAKANIFIMPINGGPERQLTFLDNSNQCPVWSPDGQEIAFVALDNAGSKVMTINSQGGSVRTISSSKVLMADPLNWAPGEEILYKRYGNRNYYFINPNTGQERPLVQNDSVGWMHHLCYSPDHKKAAVSWNRKPASGIYLISLEDSSQVLLRSCREHPIKWSLDGNWIYTRRNDQKFPDILKIPVGGGKVDTLIHLPFENANFVDITGDGDKIICAAYEAQSDIWLMENFDPEIK